MSELTADEHTVLLIAGQGESMIPAGRWENPVLDLAHRGLLVMRDPVNYAITPKGRVALEREEQAENKALSEALTRVRGAISGEVIENVVSEADLDRKEFERLQKKYGW